MAQGDILKRMGVVAGAEIDSNQLEEMKKCWMEVYLGFMMLLSHNPATTSKLEAMKLKLAEANELIMNLELGKEVK